MEKTDIGYYSTLNDIRTLEKRDPLGKLVVRIMRELIRSEEVFGRITCQSTSSSNGVAVIDSYIFFRETFEITRHYDSIAESHNDGLLELAVKNLSESLGKGYILTEHELGYIVKRTN